jgi:hypothetical protein
MTDILLNIILVIKWLVDVKELLKGVTTTYKMFKSYFLNDFVYIFRHNKNVEKVSLNDLEIISQIQLEGYLSYQNGCVVKHLDNKLYLAIGGTNSDYPSYIIKIDMSSFMVEEKFLVGSAIQNSRYSLYRVHFMSINLETKCIYICCGHNGVFYYNILNWIMNLI